MKQRILDILAFNEPADPKAQSVIFRYAIFTPQEEMKAIIWMRADSRLQTLRKAFRIEDYRIAQDNSKTLANSIKEKSIKLASHAADLESCREKCKARKGEIAKCEEELTTLGRNKADLDGKVTSLREKVDVLRRSTESLVKAAGEVPLLEADIKDKNSEVVNLENEIQELESETGKLQPEIEKLSNMPEPTQKTGDQLKEELRMARQREREMRSAQDIIGAKIGDYESVERNKVCPTCDRPAEPEEFEEKIRLKKEEKSKALAEVDSCEIRIKEIEALQDSLREYNRTQDRLQTLVERVKKDQERIGKNREKTQRLKEQVTSAKERLEKAREHVEEFNRVSAEIDGLSRELKEDELQLTKVEKGISGSQRTREMLTREVDELEAEIQAKEKERKTAERLKEYQMWLEDFFIPTLQSIETHVMMNINQEFNQHFQKWWTMLVDDPGKESRIDEDFTPIVEQDGYEQDYNYLSGGEKTSLALAYRLSLNTIVQKVSSGIKSNLLILDEPTDGFSKEQLFKIREILDELKCPQVIMVSHEKELESFADQVMRIEKKDGISQIKAA